MVYYHYHGTAQVVRLKYTLSLSEKEDSLGLIFTLPCLLQLIGILHKGVYTFSGAMIFVAAARGHLYIT